MPIQRRALIQASALTALSASAPLPAVASSDAMPNFGPRRQVLTPTLAIDLVDLGPHDGPVVILLHGWPYDIHTYAEVAPLLAQAGYRVLVPSLRGYAGTTFRSPEALRNGQQAAFAVDVIELMDALGVQRAVIGGCDWGARTACVVAALWPQRCQALVSVSGYLVVNRELNRQPLPPAGELAWWYQFYFATQRGELGYARHLDAFARQIWEQASPRWRFDANTFARSAASLHNADHVAVVVHNYRWRLGLADGERRFDALEARLAAAPVITVPAITLEGDANGAPHPSPSSYAGKFTGRYEHRTLGGGIGHNLPQEAPAEFARAIFDVTRG